MYKNQTQNKTLNQTSIWRKWIQNIPAPRNDYFTTLNKNKENYATQSNYQSSYTIKSSEQQNSITINQTIKQLNIDPNQHHNSQNERILINKCDLIEFTQLFAQQKLKLQKQIESLKQDKKKLCEKENMLNYRVDELLKQILKEKKISEQKQSQINKINYEYEQRLASKQQELILIKNRLTQIDSFQLQLSEQKTKFTKLQRQLNGQKAKYTQLRKKYQFLQQKIKYQTEQNNRYQHLLKVKQQIIQNFQWQKSVNSSRLQKSIKKGKQLKNIINKHIDKSGSGEENSLEIENRMSVTKKNEYKLDNSYKKYYQRESNNKKQQINEILDLSQINYNNGNVSEMDIFQKSAFSQMMYLNNSNNNFSQVQANNSMLYNNMNQKKTSFKQFKTQNPLKKYKIGKQTTQKNIQKQSSSKKKLNISLKRNNQSNHSKQSISSPKSKPKNIVLKRININRLHSNNNSSGVQNQLSDSKNVQSFYNQKINYLQKNFRQKQEQFMKTLQMLKEQNQMLKNRLLYISKIRSQPNHNNESINQSLILGESKNYNNVKTNEDQKLIRNNKLLKEKCMKLEKQLEITFKKYIKLSQRNQYLEERVKSLQQTKSQINQLSRNLTTQLSYSNTNSRPTINNKLPQPQNINPKDLTTPQFRYGIQSHNFFPKSKSQTIDNQFQNINLTPLNSNRNLLATFERKRTIEEEQDQSVTNHIQNQYQYKIEGQIQMNESKGKVENKIIPMSMSIYQNSMIEEQNQLISENQELLAIQRSIKF